MRDDRSPRAAAALHPVPRTVVMHADGDKYDSMEATMPRTPKTPSDDPRATADAKRQLTDPLPVIGQNASQGFGDVELPDEELGALDHSAEADDLLSESGDMRGFDAPPSMPGGGSGGKKTRSPVVGSLSFMQVDLPLVTLDALQAWLMDVNHDQLPGPEGEPVPYKVVFRAQVEAGEYSEAYGEFLLDVIGRDMDADEDRPLTERHYDAAAWLGRSFRSAMAKYQVEHVQVAVGQALGQYKAGALERFRAQFPDMPIDQLHYLLDIPTI